MGIVAGGGEDCRAWADGVCGWLAWVGGLWWAAAVGGGISAGGCLAEGEAWGVSSPVASGRYLAYGEELIECR